MFVVASREGSRNGFCVLVSRAHALGLRGLSPLKKATAAPAMLHASVDRGAWQASSANARALEKPSTEHAGTAHVPTNNYGSAGIARNRVARSRREFIGMCPQKLRFEAGLRRDRLHGNCCSVLAPAGVEMVTPSMLRAPAPSAIAAPFLPLKSASAGLSGIRCANPRCSRTSYPAAGKPSHDVSSERVRVRQRGHLRRRAFCAGLVFAFSLWRV